MSFWRVTKIYMVVLCRGSIILSPKMLIPASPPSSLSTSSPHLFTDKLTLLPGRRSPLVRAVNKDEQFQVDPEKAREALRNLDQQFQSQSQKQVRFRPKNQPAAPPPVKFTRNQTKEASEGFTGEFFTYTAAALLAFSIFYNVFFYTVIKPSIDGFSEDVPITTVVETQIPN